MRTPRVQAVDAGNQTTRKRPRGLRERRKRKADDSAVSVSERFQVRLQSGGFQISSRTRRRETGCDEHGTVETPTMSAVPGWIRVQPSGATSGSKHYRNPTGDALLPEKSTCLETSSGVSTRTNPSIAGRSDTAVLGNLLQLMGLIRHIRRLYAAPEIGVLRHQILFDRSGILSKHYDHATEDELINRHRDYFDNL